MKGFDPATSFGYEESRRYDAVEVRGDEQQTVAFLARLAGQRNALEFAVGTGRIALPLMRAGVQVDGIELSPDMVDRLREKPGGDAIDVRLGDMSRVTTGRAYGLVYLVYNTIGNLLSQDDQVRCFENAARHLADGGAFLLECRVPTAPLTPGHGFVNAERVAVDQVDQPIRQSGARRGHVADHHVQRLATGLLAQPVDHVLGLLDSVDPHARAHER